MNTPTIKNSMTFSTELLPISYIEFVLSTYICPVKVAFFAFWQQIKTTIYTVVSTSKSPSNPLMKEKFLATLFALFAALFSSVYPTTDNRTGFYSSNSTRGYNKTFPTYSTTDLHSGIFTSKGTRFGTINMGVPYLSTACKLCVTNFTNVFHIKSITYNRG